MGDLILDKSLKMTNIVNLTEARIKKLTMADLKEIFAAIDEHDAKIIVEAIKQGRFDKVAHVIEFVTYKVMQEKAENGK